MSLGLTGQLILHVLKELVANLVDADERAGLGITCRLSTSTQSSYPQLYPLIPMYCSQALWR